MATPSLLLLAVIIVALMSSHPRVQLSRVVKSVDNKLKEG